MASLLNFNTTILDDELHALLMTLKECLDTAQGEPGGSPLVVLELCLYSSQMSDVSAEKLLPYLDGEMIHEKFSSVSRHTTIISVYLVYGQASAHTVPAELERALSVKNEVHI
jgi:hypothetical protein